ncbi:MAG TPA: hypothetical protein VGH91_11130 [Gammaproteobacteria bacterium]|jgi:hypothetical protein
MTDIPRIPKTPDHDLHDATDQVTLREAAKAGYEGAAVVDISHALKRRDQQRAERERDAAKVHYLGTPQKPQP